MASTTAIEALFMIKKGIRVRLSAQELIDCVGQLAHDKTLYKEGDFRSGNAAVAFEYVISHGLRREKDYKFRNKRGEPKERKESDKIYKISSYHWIFEKEKNVMKIVYEQPVVGSILATKAFRELKGEIYEGLTKKNVKKLKKEKGEELNHDVVIMGYGTDHSTQNFFWLIQNSWGTDWGVEGFGRVLRNSSLSKNKKPILFDFVYPSFRYRSSEETSEEETSEEDR